MKSVFPPFDIRLTCKNLTLRLARDEELEEIARSSRGRILPAGSSFLPWVSAPSPDYERGFMAHHWDARAQMGPDAWRLHFGVFLEGARGPVGFQSLNATRFPLLHSVRTGSWLLMDHQSRGIGTLMRAMVLELAFREFGATEAATSAAMDNEASFGVSRRLGYELNGQRLVGVNDVAVEAQEFRLLASDWTPRPEVLISGIAETKQMLGLAAG